ncbi:hypothetical protein G210_3705 [Candida maltosa Xu316]|uniref:Uncharacterized protein n=1 Tax=Candida maltosa (strain Xu316) TaxID=1245528 RepID=M3J2I1_CANMX|nr:hypothetical protein G210_3705 [Candida maltosa Xu316]
MNRLIEALNEMNEGFDLLDQIWMTIFSRDDSVEGVKKLKNELLENREALLKLLINSARYDLYHKLIVNTVPGYGDEIEFTLSDKLLEIMEFQSLPDEKLTFNREKIEIWLKHKDILTSFKRELITTFMTTALTMNKNTAATEEKYANQLEHFKLFLIWTKMIGDMNCFLDPNNSTYDQVLRLAGAPPINVLIKDFLEDVIRIVSSEYGPKYPYPFITAMMKSFMNSSPNLTIRYFMYKEQLVETKSMERSKIFSCNDLTFTMQACLNSDKDRVKTLYQQNEDLHDGDEGAQEAILLELFRINQEWRSLQVMFEDMYGRGTLPKTVHYGITMEALNSLCADAEMERLYEQMIQRGLSINAAIFEPLMKVKVRQGNQAEVVRLFDSYVLNCLKGKADPKGIAPLFPLVLQIPRKKNNMVTLLKYFTLYIKRENVYKITIIDGEAVKIALKYMANMHALKYIEMLKDLIIDSHKEDKDFYVGMISAYSKLDQFELADEMAYEAHGKSAPPFSELDIWAVQLKNNIKWLKNSRTKRDEDYNLSKIRFISRTVYCTNARVLDCAGGAALLAELIAYYTSLKNFKLAQILLRKARIMNMRNELLSLPRLRNLYSYNKLEDVVRIFKIMDKKNVKMSGKTFQLVFRTALRLDSKLGDEYESSTAMLKQVFQQYGLEKGKPKKVGLDFEKDSLYIARMVIDFLRYAGPQKGTPVFLTFVERMYEELQGCVSYDMRTIIYEGFELIYGLNERILEKEIKQTESLINKYVKDYPLDGDIILPRSLSQSYPRLILKMRKILHKEKDDFTVEDYGKILDIMAIGAKFSSENFSDILMSVLTLDKNPHFEKVLNVVESRLSYGSELIRKTYLTKKMCYEICLKYLSDNYKDDEKIMAHYADLNQFYRVRSMDDVRTHVRRTGIENFLRSRSGMLFNVKTDAYGSRSMNHYNFLKYFSPERIINRYLKLGRELYAELHKQIRVYQAKDVKGFYITQQKYPRTIGVLYNNDLRFPKLLSMFRRTVNTFVDNNEKRKYKAITYLERSLLDTPYKMFISKTADQSTPMKLGDTRLEEQHVSELPEDTESQERELKELQELYELSQDSGSQDGDVQEIYGPQDISELEQDGDLQETSKLEQDGYLQEITELEEESTEPEQDSSEVEQEAIEPKQDGEPEQEYSEPEQEYSEVEQESSEVEQDGEPKQESSEVEQEAIEPKQDGNPQEAIEREQDSEPKQEVIVEK